MRVALRSLVLLPVLLLPIAVSQGLDVCLLDAPTYHKCPVAYIFPVVLFVIAGVFSREEGELCMYVVCSTVRCSSRFKATDVFRV